MAETKAKRQLTSRAELIKQQRTITTNDNNNYNNNRNTAWQADKSCKKSAHSNRKRRAKRHKNCGFIVFERAPKIMQRNIYVHEGTAEHGHALPIAKTQTHAVNRIAAGRQREREREDNTIDDAKAA